MTRIEILNGEKIEIIPIARGKTELGVNLLVGKVLGTGEYVMWRRNMSDPKHPFWMYVHRGGRDSLVSELYRLCEDARPMSKRYGIIT